MRNRNWWKKDILFNDLAVIGQWTFLWRTWTMLQSEVIRRRLLSAHPKYCPVWTSAAISPDLAYNNPKGQSDYATHMQRAPRV